jgi:hypothetical protein
MGAHNAGATAGLHNPISKLHGGGGDFLREFKDESVQIQFSSTIEVVWSIRAQLSQIFLQRTHEQIKGIIIIIIGKGGSPPAALTHCLVRGSPKQTILPRVTARRVWTATGLAWG